METTRPDEIQAAILPILWGLVAGYINHRLSADDGDYPPPSATFAHAWTGAPEGNEPPSVVLVSLQLGNPDDPATLRVDLDAVADDAIAMHRESGGRRDSGSRRSAGACGYRRRAACDGGPVGGGDRRAAVGLIPAGRVYYPSTWKTELSPGFRVSGVNLLILNVVPGAGLEPA